MMKRSRSEKAGFYFSGPHFSLSRQRKVAAGAVEKKPLFVWTRNKVLVSAFSVGRGKGLLLSTSMPRESELRHRAKTDTKAPLFAAAARPGGGIQRRGPAGPFLCAVRGCGGEVGTPPRFWWGLGRCLFAKDISPKSFLENHCISPNNPL